MAWAAGKDQHPAKQKLPYGKDHHNWASLSEPTLISTTSKSLYLCMYMMYVCNNVTVVYVPRVR